ncbi:MarR family winged helix-turn-helix transcriptional regulator [Bacillus inaquosorum]|nr:MarR family winged helix-turn-helix transcriptional regulator [Bacillus inaquosorum]MCY9344414.1 MarR family winged helix-turn-helix transcriptional regulator [Bacillus inaquosorum]MCY9379404.1 MarR family winged helix-turn-helix transcriptional regulator [Bacillus inaquosorum]
MFVVENEIREHIDKLSSKMRRDYSDMLRELDLHVGQDNLLCRLWTEDGQTHNQLSERLNCEPPTVTNMVKTLEKKGFVYRKKDLTDGRVSRVYLTDQGLAVREPIEKVWTRQQEKLLRGLTGEDRQLLNELLQKMEENLR